MNDFDNEREEAVMNLTQPKEVANRRKTIMLRSQAMLIQSQVRKYLAQEEMLRRWEDSFYDQMAIVMQTKVKQYLAVKAFQARVYR